MSNSTTANPMQGLFSKPQREGGALRSIGTLQECFKNGWFKQITSVRLSNTADRIPNVIIIDANGDQATALIGKASQHSQNAKVGSFLPKDWVVSRVATRIVDETTGDLVDGPDRLSVHMPGAEFDDGALYTD